MQQLHSKWFPNLRLQKLHQRNADCCRPFHNFLPWRKGGGRHGEEEEERERGGTERERERKRGGEGERENRGKNIFGKDPRYFPTSSDILKLPR